MINPQNKVRPHFINQATYQAMCEQATTGIIFLDSEGLILESNPKACEIIGLIRDEIQGRKLIDFIHADDQVNSLNILNKIKTGETPHHIIESKVLRTNSELIDVRFSFNRIEDRFKTLQYIVGFLEDISLRVLIEKDRDNMMKKLFQSSKLASLGQLAAGVGHEINNPLAIINGYLEVMETKITKNEYSKEEFLALLEKQQMAIARISNIVNGLRSYSCENDLDVVKIDIHQVINSVLDITLLPYEKDGVQILPEFSKGDFFVQGNFNKFQQVITNLLSNAKDATEGKRRRIVVIKTLLDGEMGLVKITDNGKGIEPEILDKVFDAFFTTKEVGKGSGLGLGIVKNIVEASGGSVELTSQPHLGATICLKLPLFKSPLNMLTHNLRPSMTGKVLIVEDEKDICLYLKNILVQLGFEVDTAENGFLGYDLLTKQKYKYVFTDLKMPEMGGEKMIKKIKKYTDFEGKIFIITGVVEKIGSEISLMADECLMKPFDHQKIINLITKYEKN